MTASTLGKLCALAVLIAQVTFSPASHAASAQAAPFEEELTKQGDIYRSKGEKVPKGYVIDRSLLSYAYTLPQEFARSLAELGPTERWLDIGAGEGQAILDYCASKYDPLNPPPAAAEAKKARAVAISIEDRRTPRWQRTVANIGPGQIQYLFGRTLREYSPAELGQFKVITDVMGGFSYATELSVFMERALSLLEVNGDFYTVLADVHSESGHNRPHYPDSPYLTEIRNVDGAEVKMCSWLKRISCVEVSCEFKSDWTPPIEVYQIRKTCDDVNVPALVPVHYEAGTPPERSYRLRDRLIFPSKLAEPAEPAARGNRSSETP